MSHLPSLALLALAIACQPADPVETLLACPESACRSDALRAAWGRDPQRVEAWLANLAEADDQALLVEQLALSEPAEAGRLCALLPARGRARERCEARVVRPHLGTRQRKAAPPEAAPDAASGPRSATLAVLALPDPPWLAAPEAQRAAALADCDQRDPTICARFRARERADALDRDGAGLACLAGDPERGPAYAECLFQTAEALAETRGAAGIGTALELCAWSTFGPMCAAHVLMMVGPPVPAADQLRAEDLAGPLAVVAAIREATAAQPRLQAAYVDRYWSTWTATTYRWAQQVDGRLLPLLPAEARHHVPVAVAARLLRDRDPRRADLAELVEATATALADPGRPPLDQPRRKVHPLNSQHSRDAWPEDRGEERRIQAAWVMGPGRRALVPDDPTADLRIAVLEAAFQAGSPPPAGFFLGAAADPAQHRLVRWTGLRLGAALDPAAARALRDTDPLLQATQMDSPDGGGRPPPRGAAAPTPMSPGYVPPTEPP